MYYKISTEEQWDWFCNKWGINPYQKLRHEEIWRVACPMPFVVCNWTYTKADFAERMSAGTADGGVKPYTIYDVGEMMEQDKLLMRGEGELTPAFAGLIASKMQLMLRELLLSENIFYGKHALFHKIDITKTFQDDFDAQIQLSVMVLPLGKGEIKEHEASMLDDAPVSETQED
jgi:hypothetical protein